VTGSVPVTVSIGAARAAGTATPGELLGRADAHLYAAKRSGRDRVVTDAVAA
jgi:two-component system, cell cycle response regulator